MTKHEAARLVASRNFKECEENAGKMCEGIDCGECFDCHGSTRGMSNKQAAIFIQGYASAWLAANPEPKA
jgi:hypothetical protein